MLDVCYGIVSITEIYYEYLFAAHVLLSLNCLVSHTEFGILSSAGVLVTFLSL